MLDNANKNGDSSYNDENEIDENEILDFVQPVSEYVSTDIVTDIKSGIFNLFVSLYNNNAAKHGPVVGLQMSLEYINNISKHFQEILEKHPNN